MPGRRDPRRARERAADTINAMRDEKSGELLPQFNRFEKFTLWATDNGLEVIKQVPLGKQTVFHTLKSVEETEE